MTTYTTYGNVRGSSGKRHRSRETAEQAIARDQRGCERQGGYSDRIVAVIGPANRLYHDDDCTQPVWPSHGRSTGAARL